MAIIFSSRPKKKEDANHGILQSIFNKIFVKPHLEPKDPMDWSLTKSSTQWHTDQYCPRCKSSTSHSERMADVCNSCGFFGNMMSYRSSRKIWNGNRWVIQRKYGNSKSNYTIEEI